MADEYIGGRLSCIVTALNSLVEIESKRLECDVARLKIEEETHKLLLQFKAEQDEKAKQMRNKFYEKDKKLNSLLNAIPNMEDLGISENDIATAADEYRKEQEERAKKVGDKFFGI